MPYIYILMKNQLGLMVCKVVIIAIIANMGNHDAFQKKVAHQIAM
jgi:hypothetical protein